MWIDWRDVTHLSEVRQTKVHAPQKNYLTIDVAIQFYPADRDVTLDLSRGEPGKGGLFYSGLTIRFDNAMTPGQLLDADGRTENMDIFGNRSQWCGFSGRHGQDGQVYGITIVDHPDNPYSPTPWWVRNAENYALIQPSLCYHEPLELAEDDTLKLRYRVILHKGRVDPDVIEQAVQNAAD